MCSIRLLSRYYECVRWFLFMYPMPALINVNEVVRFNKLSMFFLSCDKENFFRKDLLDYGGVLMQV